MGHSVLGSIVLLKDTDLNDKSVDVYKYHSLGGGLFSGHVMGALWKR